MSDADRMSDADPADTADTADTVIAALRAGHDQLVSVIDELSDDQLTTPTMLGEWTVAQVLSHLGSGAVITRASLGAAISGRPNPGPEANQAVWAEWDALGPREQYTRFLQANGELLDGIDTIPHETRRTMRVDVGFLPEPLDLTGLLKLRLNEFALHSWDVRAFLDDAAVVEESAVPLLLDVVPVFLPFLAKPEHLGRPATLRVDLTRPSHRFGVVLSPDGSSLTDVPERPDATLGLPAEAWLRLVTGRLRREYTPAGITVDGPYSLADLRRVFPGF